MNLPKLTIVCINILYLCIVLFAEISNVFAQTMIDENGFALLIDVPEYGDSKIPPLIPGQGDVDNIKSILVSFGGFPERQVIALSGKNATREGITDALTSIIENARYKPNARFLLFFRGRSLDSQGQNYYLPYNARIGAVSTYIEESEFERWLNQAQFKKSLILLSWSISNQDRGGQSILLSNVFADEQTDSDLDRNITLTEIEAKIGNQSVRISGNRSNVIIRLPSLLVINSQPPGATVIIDGQEKGKTPAKMTNLSSGRHRINVKKDLYIVPDERQFEIANVRGQIINLPIYQLNPIRIFGLVRFPPNISASDIDIRIADTGYHQKLSSDGTFSFGDWQAYGILESGKKYRIIAQTPLGNMSMTSFTFRGNNDISVELSIGQENWVESVDRLMRSGKRPSADNFINSMLQSYEQGDPKLVIDIPRMPPPIIMILGRNVEGRLRLKPNDIRLNFLAAKLAEAGNNKDLAKRHWQTLKANAPKDSIEYKQAIERLKEISPSALPLIIIISAVLSIVGVFFGVYLFKRKRRLSVFREIPNPYIAGKPISDQGMFFGRDDVFTFIKDKLERNAKDITIVLHGGRRTGKTSIMYQIFNGRLGGDFVPVFIDMQEMAGVDAHGFFRLIAQKVIEVFRSKASLTANENNKIDELYQSLSDRNISAFQNFNDLMSFISSKLAGKYLIFLIDEYEILERKVQQGDISDEVFTYLRHLMQNIGNLTFIFSGSSDFAKRQRREWSLMFNMAQTKEISFLNKEDTIDLVTKPVQNYMRYDKKAIEYVFRLTAGQPFFTQAICFHIVENLNDKKLNKVMIADVESACRDLVENAPYHFSYIWSELSYDGKIIISLLAEVLQNKDSYATIDNVMSLMPKYDLKYGRADVGKTLAQLCEIDLVERKEGSEEFRFKMALTHAWIQAEHLTWGVLREVQDN